MSSRIDLARNEGRLVLCILSGLLLVCCWCEQSSGQPYNLSRAQSLIHQGERLLNQGKVKSATDVFQNLLAICRHNSECRAYASFWLGRCYLASTRLKKAAHWIDEAESAFSRLAIPEGLCGAYHMKGKLLEAQCRFEEAFAYYSRADAQLARSSQKPFRIREKAFLHESRTRVYIKLREYSKARKELAAARRLSRGNEGRLLELDGHEAQILVQTQKFAKAKALYSRLLDYCREHNRADLSPTILCNLGRVQAAQSNYRKAEQAYEQALTIARESDNRRVAAEALHNLGWVEWNKGDYTASKRYYSKALAIRDELGLEQPKAETTDGLGLVYLAEGEYRKALECFKRCLAISEKSGLRKQQANEWHNMALLLKEYGRFQESRRLSRKAIAMAEEIGDRKLRSTAILRLGNLFEYYGDFDSALARYREAAKTQREIGDRLFLSNTLFHIAKIQASRGDFKGAEDDFRESLEIRESIDAPRVEALCNFALALLMKARRPGMSAAQRKRLVNEASRLISRAEREIKPSHKNDAMSAQFARGRLRLDRGECSKAIQIFKRLGSMAAACGSLRYTFLSQTGLGLSYERANNLPAAEKAFNEAVRSAESIRNTLDEQERLTFLNGEQILGVKHVEPYEGLARVLHKSGKAAKSLGSAELTKARAFADTMEHSVRKVLGKADKDLRRNLENAELQAQVNHKQLEKCVGAGGASSQIGSLKRTKGGLRTRLAEARSRLEETHPEFRSVVNPGAVSVDLAGFSHVSDDDWILSYEVTDLGAIIYLTRGASLVTSIFQEVSRTEIERLVNRYHTLINELTEMLVRRQTTLSGMKKSKTNLEFMRTGFRLFELLVLPALRALPKDAHVCIVPDGALGRIPFEALPMELSGASGSASGRIRYFEDRNPVSYYQSITAMNMVRKSIAARGAPGERFLIVADPIILCDRGEDRPELSEEEIDRLFEDLGSSTRDDAPARPAALICSMVNPPARLEKTAELAEKLKRSFGKDIVESMVGKYASLNDFETRVAPNIRDFGRVLFATHGAVAGSIPGLLEPAIMLSMTQPGADGWLPMSRVLQLEMNADVVFLLACETGLGKELAGEGVMGLGRAFQLAGSRSVLVSLWQVDETRSVLLGENFFENLRANHDNLTSLRLARSKLRSMDGGQFDHPLFWAAFVLVGEVGPKPAGVERRSAPKMASIPERRVKRQTATGPYQTNTRRDRKAGPRTDSTVSTMGGA